MPEVIKLNSAPAEPQGAPQPPPGAAGSPNPEPSVIGQGAVSEAEALRGAEHTKIATLQPGFGGPVNTATPGGSVPVGGLMDAKLTVELMDSTLPSLMVYLLYKIGMKLRKSDLQLTEKEKATLHPVVQRCLDQLMLNIQNPFVLLTVSLGIIYGSKIVEKGLPQLWDKKQQKQQDEALKEKAAATGTPIDELKKEAVPISADPPPPPYEPSEAEIKAKMKAHKYSYDNARKFLINLHNKAWKDQLRRQRRAA